MNSKHLKELLSNEELCWREIQELRASFNLDLFSEVAVNRREEALARGVNTVREALKILGSSGINLKEMEPGHGIGHLTRDYVNALRLTSALDGDPKHLFIGLVSGTLHDIGCASVDRYEESERAVRHAEASAILLNQIFKESSLGLNTSEQILIRYALAGHTNYLRPTDVTCKDGVTRRIEPYADIYESKPILGIHLPRWIDRLNFCDPSFVGRHYLTLSREHSDYGEKGFYSVKFEEHMRPLFRTNEEIKAAGGNRTMLEHLNMFAQSQNNQSVYGQYDYGEMVNLRDAYKERLLRIIEAVRTREITPQEKISNRWTVFLAKNIEPTDLGRKTANQLKKMFENLPAETQMAWANGFWQTMKEYVEWSEPILNFLNKIPKEWRCLPSIAEDVRKIIDPNNLQKIL